MSFIKINPLISYASDIKMGEEALSLLPGGVSGPLRHQSFIRMVHAIQY